MFNDICTEPFIERDTADDDLTVLAFVFRQTQCAIYAGQQCSIGNFSDKFLSSKCKKGNSFVDVFFNF
jgi:hypothetical protein